MKLIIFSFPSWGLQHFESMGAGSGRSLYASTEFHTILVTNSVTQKIHIRFGKWLMWSQVSKMNSFPPLTSCTSDMTKKKNYHYILREAVWVSQLADMLLLLHPSEFLCGFSLTALIKWFHWLPQLFPLFKGFSLRCPIKRMMAHWDNKIWAHLKLLLSLFITSRLPRGVFWIN